MACTYFTCPCKADGSPCVDPLGTRDFFRDPVRLCGCGNLADEVTGYCEPCLEALFNTLHPERLSTLPVGAVVPAPTDLDAPTTEAPELGTCWNCSQTLVDIGVEVGCRSCDYGF